MLISLLLGYYGQDVDHAGGFLQGRLLLTGHPRTQELRGYTTLIRQLHVGGRVDVVLWVARLELVQIDSSRGGRVHDLCLYRLEIE